MAVDVGGTHVRVALFPATAEHALIVERIPTQDPAAPLLERLEALMARLWPQDRPVRAIGVAAPGPLDPFQGVVYATPNIPEWRGLPLQRLLQDRFGVPVVLGNDANLAALGEWQFGAGRGHHHLLYLTVSTGIGGGVIVDDRLLVGAHGLGAELGHVPIMDDGPLCSCGRRGHLEALAAGPAIVRYVRHRRADLADRVSDVDSLTAADVAHLARQGVAPAMDAFRQAGTALGRALAGFLHIFNPTVVILGGGVSQSHDLLFPPLEQTMRAEVMDAHFLEDLTLTTACLGDAAGLMGALALARQQYPVR